MIVTVTANPSLDRTLELGAPLARGEVQRAGVVRTEPGGKGVNVARVVAAAGLATRALLPARPGDPLREERLAAELGVSRNTLREAMRTLAHEGLIVHEANRGARVTAPTRASVRDIYLVRRTVEPPALRAAGPEHPGTQCGRLTVRRTR